MSDIKQIIETLNGLKRIQPKIIEKDIDEAIECIELLRAYQNRPNDKYWYEQGAKDFAEWLQRNDAFIADAEFDSYKPKLFFSSVESALAEWQKGEESE